MNTSILWWKDDDSGYLLFTTVPPDVHPDEASQEPDSTAFDAPTMHAPENSHLNTRANI